MVARPLAKAYQHPNTCPPTLSMGIGCAQPIDKHTQDTQTMATPSAKRWKRSGWATNGPHWCARLYEIHRGLETSASRAPSSFTVRINLMLAHVGPPDSRPPIQPQSACDGRKDIDEFSQNLVVSNRVNRVKTPWPKQRVRVMESNMRGLPRVDVTRLTLKHS